MQISPFASFQRCSSRSIYHLCRWEEHHLLFGQLALEFIDLDNLIIMYFEIFLCNFVSNEAYDEIFKNI